MSGFLDGPLTSFAFCWRLERRDGVALGLTGHDRDLIVDGFRYRAAPGITPAALDAGLPGADPATEIAGALTDEALTEADLRAGRWDGASVALLAVDWTAPERWLTLTRGTLGAVRFARGRFSAELSGADAVLAAPLAEETSPECRARLGDRRCRVDMAGRRQLARVIAADETLLTLDRAEPAPNGWGWGELRWLDGGNAGLADIVLASIGDRLTLAAPPRFPVAPGTRVMIDEGCDKSFATCRDRFANAANFRGEPHLPGTDLLTRYPGE